MHNRIDSSSATVLFCVNCEPTIDTATSITPNSQ